MNYSNTDTNLSYYEKFYLYLTQSVRPKCHCGNLTRFISLKDGFREFCGNKCAQLSEKTQAKIKYTCLNKYGSECFFSSEKGKNNLKNFCEKNGVTNISQLEKVKNKKIETCRENYGTDYYVQSKEGKEVIKQSFLKNHNTTSGFLLCQKDRALKRIEFLKDEAKKYDMEFMTNHHNHIEYKCLISGETFLLNKSTRKGRLKMGMSLNLIQYPLNDLTSQSHIEIADWVKTYDDSFEMNNTKVLNGKELDLYSSKLNIAIEFNGLYWHSNLFKDKNYHLNKSNICERLGIRLIHIFEDEWIYHKDKVKNIILEHLGFTTKICINNDLIQIDYKDAEFFLKENYLYEPIYDGNYYGYYNNELLYVCHYNDNNIIDISCCKLGYSLNTYNNIILDKSKYNFSGILYENPKLYYIDCDVRTNFKTKLNIHDCGKILLY